MTESKEPIVSHGRGGTFPLYNLHLDASSNMKQAKETSAPIRPNTSTLKSFARGLLATRATAPILPAYPPPPSSLLFLGDSSEY
jgi:hypothetical protein